MATYILVSLGNFAQAVDDAIEKSTLPGDRHKIESGKWLINSPIVTSKEIADKLGVSDTTTFMICPIRGYYGRASSDVWEWLAAKS